MSETKWQTEIVLYALIGGFVMGAICGYLIYQAATPSDKVEARTKINELEQRVAEQSETITRLDSEKSETARQVSLLQDQVTRAKKEVEEAMAAKPDRFKIVKEGFRTWRLDSATGKMCLMLAPDVTWNDPKVAGQGCEVQ